MKCNRNILYALLILGIFNLYFTITLPGYGVKNVILLYEAFSLIISNALSEAIVKPDQQTIF